MDMKRIGFFLLGCLVLLAFMAPSQAAKRGLGKTVAVSTPFVNGVYRALLIGNNEYKDPEGLWVPLKTPIKDTEAIAEALQTHYGFNPDHITFLKNATRAEILSSFSKLAKTTKENDSVFIYYAGHGYANPDTKEAFWIPIDAEGKEDYTYVRNSTLKSKLAVVADRAKHVFLVSDSCFSATLIREGHRGIKQEEKTEHYYRKVARKKSVQILAAGGLEYVDDNYKETGHSPFTHFFLKQLEHNTESYYSATELSLEVTKAVSA
ncbi:caspase domain-containing protein, partial [Thermodesulfobacteriota bacterium]